MQSKLSFIVNQMSKCITKSMFLGHQSQHTPTWTRKILKQPNPYPLYMSCKALPSKGLSERIS